MKKNRLLIITLSLSLFVSTLVGCGGNQPVINKVQEQGGISSVELDKADEKDTVLPKYDINSIEESTTFINFVEKDSYYKNLLDTRNIIVYNEIKNAYNDYKSEVLLSKNITPEELFKIMSIMYLDDPIMFQMKTTYDYYLDSNGYVYKVNLYYSINEISYRSWIVTIEDHLLKIYSGLVSDNNKDTESITEYTAYKYVMKNYLEITPNSKNTFDATILGTFNKQYTTHNFSKYFTLVCRYLGLDTTVMIGKYTNDDLGNKLTAPSEFDIENYQNVKDKYTTVTTTSDGIVKYSVQYDYNNYAMWNIVKINDSWYHFDHITGCYIAKNDANFLNISSHNSMLHFVNDYTISMTRIFYYSENILGKSPLCNSKQFQTSYRNNNFILSHTEEQMLTYLTQLIEILPSRNTKYLNYQFEDEETFNYFINNFDKVVKAYNNTTINQILNYEIGAFRETLTVVVNNFKYK